MVSRAIVGAAGLIAASILLAGFIIADRPAPVLTVQQAATCYAYQAKQNRNAQDDYLVRAMRCPPLE